MSIKLLMKNNFDRVAQFSSSQQSGWDVWEVFNKGDKIYVEDVIRSRQWQTEDGTVKHTTEIQVTEFTFCQLKGMKTTNKF
jgi:single-stranded DNA-binding protein